MEKNIVKKPLEEPKAEVVTVDTVYNKPPWEEAGISKASWQDKQQQFNNRDKKN